MKQKPQTCVAYCTTCHNYVFMSHSEEIVKTAANQHVEETHHTVIVGTLYLASSTDDGLLLLERE